MKKIIITVVTLGMLAGTPSALADSVYISNSVNNSVSTGGNSGGSVTEGESHASVSVHTEVNGQVVQDSHEEKTGTGDQSISVVNSYATSTGSTSVTVTGSGEASTSLGAGIIASLKNHSTSSVSSQIKNRIEAIKRNLNSFGGEATGSSSTTIAISTSSKGETSVGSIVIVIKNIFHYVFSLFTF